MRAILIGTMAMAIGGCSTTTMEAKPNPLPAECDAAKAEMFVGKDGHTTAEEARIATGARAVRVIGPDQAVTMDFRPDRLNLETDAGGKIAKARCG